MPVYEFACFRLDADKRLLLRRDGAAVGLTPKGYETLAYLVEHAGAIVEKEQLIRAIWPDTAVEENNLTQNISLLRRVLGKDEVSTDLLSLFRARLSIRRPCERCKPGRRRARFCRGPLHRGAAVPE